MTTLTETAPANGAALAAGNPLRRRRRIYALIAGALLPAFAAFLLYSAAGQRRAERARAEGLGRVLSAQIAPALRAGDAAAARRLLEALRAEAGVTSAALYDAQGRTLAAYRRSEPGSGDAEVSVPVDGGGRLMLSADLLSAEARGAVDTAVLAAVLAAGLLAAFFLAGRVERGVSGSLGRLVETLRAASRRRDYSVRAPKADDAQLGALAEGVNDLLAQIQDRDQALKIARCDFDRRVGERTSELSSVSQQLQGQIRSRSESEQRMRIIVESAPEAIVIFDADSRRFIDVNPKAAHLFGLSRERLLETDFLQVSPSLQPDGHRSERIAAERIQEALQGGAPSFEWTYNGADGRPVPCEVHLVLLPGGRGREIRSSIIDITKRKEVDRLKDEFVSTVSHELRTPLTSIEGSIGLLASGVAGALPPAAKPLAEIAHKNCKRLALLINDILDSEMIAAGRMRFAFKPVELLPLLEQAVEGNRGYAAKLDVQVVLGAAAAGALVEADSDRLMQVFNNLISNACKYSPRGEAVTVSLEARFGGWRVSVQDRGPGIPETFRSRVFQRFSQADGSDIRTKGGTGLGLSISKSIVEKHHGRIGFDSVIGQGTLFFVDLPTWSAPRVEPAKAPRILVCEDDPKVAALLVTLLQRDGFTADSAGSAGAAREALEKHAYDAMTLDLLLEDGDGVDFLRELRGRERTRRLPVVVVSVAADDRAAQLADAALDVADCTEKPVSAPRFLHAVRRAARRGEAKARVLVVEQDAGLRTVATMTLRDAAEVVGVASLAAARRELDARPCDLAVLGDRLPDGAGLSLVPQLGALPYVRLEAPVPGAASGLAETFLKSLGTLPNLPPPLRPLVSNVPVTGGSR